MAPRTSARHLAAVASLLTVAAIAQRPQPEAHPAKLAPIAEAPDQPPEVQRPGQRPPAGDGKQDGLQPAIPDLFADPDAVWFDTPREGEVWARGSSYKASFTADGFEYVPFFGSGAPRNYPVGFRLVAATLAGQDMPLSRASVSARERAVTLAHGALRERFDLSGASIEQTFVFDELPRRGTLSLAIAVNTELSPSATDAGLLFSHAELGGVRYEHAIIKDATGRTLPVPIADGTFADPDCHP